MPERRMIAKKISDDPNVNKLTDEEMLLFILMIPHLDSAGILPAEPSIIRGKVCPYRKWSDEDVKDMLTSIASIRKEKDGLPLIQLYNVNGTTYLHYTGFYSEQKIIREADSYYPKPPPLKGVRQLKEAPKMIEGEKVSPLDQILDSELADLKAYYEKELGHAITPMEFERLGQMKDEHPIEEIKRAIDRARDRQIKAPMPYINKVLAGEPEKEPETKDKTAGMDVIE